MKRALIICVNVYILYKNSLFPYGSIHFAANQRPRSEQALTWTLKEYFMSDHGMFLLQFILSQLFLHSAKNNRNGL